MTGTVQSPYSVEQVTAWLRGLFSLAWADGHFDPEEQELIAALTQDELALPVNLAELEPISPAELAIAIGNDPQAAENFLRTAVMVAVADGVYSAYEDDLLHQFCEALKLKPDVLSALRLTLYDPSQTPAAETTPNHPSLNATALTPDSQAHHDLLDPLRTWLDQMDIHDPRVARFLCKMIPPQCPFERDIQLFGHKVVHIPAMCKLNPLYDQLVGIRFRALSFLADKCGEDVTPYC